MARRTTIDPRLIALGLLTGAAVGVWAGRRAQSWADRPVKPGLIDWDRARAIAVNMNQEAALNASERSRLDAEYASLVDRTVPLVAAFTGMSLPGGRPDVFAFDRVDWINANIDSFRHMFQPIERLRSTDRDGNPNVIGVLWSGLNQSVISAELGILLGYLARRVLGQYDLALLGREPIETSGKLYFVQPNIGNMERALGLPKDDFRLWLALHETTHAFEFEAVPWLREHMNAMIDEYFGFITQDIDYLKRGMEGLKVFVERARDRGRESTSWIELIMTPEQRRLFARMQATMSIVEGYSNYVMNGVGRDLLPDYITIRTRFERRQTERSHAEKLFIRLTGLDLKMEQYRLGEAFIDHVVAAKGDDFAQRVWESPAALPSMAELRVPDDWIARMCGAAVENCSVVTLDLARIVTEINALAGENDARRDQMRFDHLRRAWMTLDVTEINRRLVNARTTFLVARGEDDARTQHPEPPLPADHVVIATDGSMILPSRHSPARFFLLNIGIVRLQYGDRPGACLQSLPTLHYGDDAMTVPNDPRRLPMNEATIGLLRAVEELRAAIRAIDSATEPTLALQDGTLILWRLESQPDSVREWILPAYLEQLREFQSRDVPIASYVSAPGSTDVMNTLRIGICDYPRRGMTINCDHCRGRIASEQHTPACDVLPLITDRALLAEFACLAPGARTPVFQSGSRILAEYVARGGPDLEVRFFYVNTGREIARIEAPRFVTDNPAHLDLVHATVLEQCRLGRGYPVALQEAHEQAVVGVQDRRVVELAVEQALARAGVVLTWTGKDGSKRGRFV